MLAITSPDIKWEYVSGHIDSEGSDGVEDMIELTPMAIPDCTFAYHGGMRNGNSYAVESTMAGTIFRTEFACRGASLGETDDDGKIVDNHCRFAISHTDGVLLGLEPTVEDVVASFGEIRGAATVPTRSTARRWCGAYSRSLPPAAAGALKKRRINRRPARRAAAEATVWSGSAWPATPRRVPRDRESRP
jgi:hypothetical protein